MRNTPVHWKRTIKSEYSDGQRISQGTSDFAVPEQGRDLVVNGLASDGNGPDHQHR